MKRRFDYDVLRVLSMFGVVYLHAAVGSLRSLNYHSLWNCVNLITAFATPAVPLFFMMSGALLLSGDKTADLNYLFRHRIPKVLVPLLCWSALIIAGTALRGDTATAAEGAFRLLNTPVAVPYWFLYALIPMYLLSPLLRQMVKDLSDVHWHYMMALWVVCTLGLFTLRSFVPPEYELLVTEHWTLNLNMVGGYLGYFLLGAYLERLKKVPSKKVLVGVILGTGLFIAVGTHWDTYARMTYSDRFTNYLTLFTLALSAAIFLLAKTCLRGREAHGRVLPWLAGISFPVYLIHPIVLAVEQRLWPVLFGTMGPGTPIQHGLYYLAAVLVCIAAATVLSSIPGVCYVFTGQSYAAACQSSNLQSFFGKKRPTD